MLFACSRPLTSNNHPSKNEYVKDEVVVKFREGVSAEKIKGITASLKCEIVRQIGATKIFLIKIKTDAGVMEIISKFKQFDEVEYAQPNYIYKPTEEK